MNKVASMSLSGYTLVEISAAFCRPVSLVEKKLIEVGVLDPKPIVREPGAHEGTFF